jgi:hypothetical protein
MKTHEELRAMTKAELSKYIDEITQTPIRKDKEYCNMVVKIFITK